MRRLITAGGSDGILTGRPRKFQADFHPVKSRSINVFLGFSSGPFGVRVPATAIMARKSMPVIVPGLRIILDPLFRHELPHSPETAVIRFCYLVPVLFPDTRKILLPDPPR